MRRLLTLIFTAALMLCLFSACGGAPTESEPTTGGTRVVTDALGREVTLPETVGRIVALGNTPRMIAYLGLADKVVGLGGSDPATITPVTAYAYANREIWADVPLVGTDAFGATDYYPEEIIAVAPDVILCTYTAELAAEIETQTGTPVIVVDQGTVFEASYEQSLRILGEVCGAEARAEEVIDYINACLAELESRTSGIPEAEKPSVLGAAATFKGVHGIEGVYSKYPVFTAINANDVTQGVSEVRGGILIDKEQVLGWNPDYIFLDSGGVPLVRQDFAASPDFYAGLDAFAAGNVYQCPSSTSYYANVDITLANCYYAACLLYPKEFSDTDFEAKADEIFRFFLGAEGYLGTIAESGNGYGPVALGDG